MATINRLLNRAIDALMWLACLCGALMMVHITIDVFSRNLLNAPIPGTIEIVSAYYMVAIAFFPLAYASREEGQIFVELFTQKIPPKPLARLDAIVAMATGTYIAVFAWASTVVAVAKTEEGEVRETAAGFMDVWPSRWFLAIGLVPMAILLFKCALSARSSSSDGESREEDV